MILHKRRLWCLWQISCPITMLHNTTQADYTLCSTQAAITVSLLHPEPPSPEDCTHYTQYTTQHINYITYHTTQADYTGWYHCVTSTPWAALSRKLHCTTLHTIHHTMTYTLHTIHHISVYTTQAAITISLLHPLWFAHHTTYTLHNTPHKNTLHTLLYQSCPTSEPCRRPHEHCSFWSIHCTAWQSSTVLLIGSNQTIFKYPFKGSLCYLCYSPSLWRLSSFYPRLPHSSTYLVLFLTHKCDCCSDHLKYPGWPNLQIFVNRIVQLYHCGLSPEIPVREYLVVYERGYASLSFISDSFYMVSIKVRKNSKGQISQTTKRVEKELSEDSDDDFRT